MQTLSLTTLLGGLGMFLLGLGLMTETLRVLAGNRLRSALLRFTRSPASGALAGALSTAVLQSSSATTVATVGFVSAGLLGFESSLGIIFGANVGSTGLGWLVALLGIRLDLGRVMLPVILLGASLRLLGRGRTATIGLAVAGVALLFVGIDALQQSLAGQGLVLDPARFDAGTVGGRLQLLLLGLMATVITQSSGAGVATMLAALAAGVVQLGQACAVVIGMDVGTTVTALIASIGATLSARRTAAAHVGFNVFTATMAFLLLPLYLQGVDSLVPSELQADLPFLLTAFHTSFNLLGVGLMLPFTHRFALLIRSLVRARRERPADALDGFPRGQSIDALMRAREALVQTFLDLIGQLLRALEPDGTHPSRPAVPLQSLQADLDRIEVFMDQIQLADLDRGHGQQLLHQLHGLDHLQRLHERCEEEPDRAETVRRSPVLQKQRRELEQVLAGLEGWIRSGQWTIACRSSEGLAREIHHLVGPFRSDVMQREASGTFDSEQGTDHLEAVRWLRRVSQHIRQICRHLEQAQDGELNNGESGAMPPAQRA